MGVKRLFSSVLVSALCLSFPKGVSADEASLIRTITVTGQGQEAVATSISQVRLGVEVRGITAAQVQADMASRSIQVVDFLKGKKVDKLTTTGINLQPQYDYSDGNRRLIGYLATNSVSFEVPTNQAGSIMDDAVKAGATRIDGISFRATDLEIANAERIALGEAALDAQTRADNVLSALNLSPQEIVQIQVNGNHSPTPFIQQEAFLMRANAADITAVEGGDQNVNASVTLIIRY